ncbi:MAG: flippase activity-associated protein Agl23, partial [Phycisphaerae bacterium]
MKDRAAFAILMLVAAAGALAFRLPKLAMRPMHTDEAVHAYKLGELVEEGRYKYNPLEYHGPTLNFLTLPVTWLRGMWRHADLDEQALRIVPVAFGVLLVVLLAGIGDGLGYPAAVFAGVLTAVSTGMVFFSRYYIMEMLLVCFAFLAVVGAWRFIKGGAVGWCVVVGVGVGLMHATKETWVLTAAAMVAAMVVNVAWGRWVARDPVRVGRHVWNWRVAVGALAAIAVAALFLSSFLRNPQGPLDSILTYFHGWRRAGGGAGEEAGNLHVNPWYFYAWRLICYRVGRGPIWTDGLIVALALVGTVAAFAGRLPRRVDAKLVRFLGVYSFVLAGMYSVIPYKTPWCILGALHGMILVAGVGAAALVRWTPKWPLKILVALLLAGGCAQLAWQAYRGSYVYYDSNYNPWVYGHSLRGVVRLGDRAEEIARVDPDGHDMAVKVFTPDAHDQWPLPWYLRRFRHVGYFYHVPDDADAPLIIFKPEVWQELEPKLKRQYQYEHRGLRPAVVLVVGIRSDLWKKYIDRKMAAWRGGKERAMMEQTDGPSSTGPAGAGPTHRFSHRAMGCVFEAVIAGADEDAARNAAEAAFEELDRMEKLLSRYSAYSDVGRINAAEVGEPVIVDIETCQCLSLARQIWSETNGAFDVTAGVPTDGAGSAPARPVGMKLLGIDEEANSVRRLDSAVKVDLGGIGKGYALDRMADLLREWDVETALIQGGSSTVLAMGSRGPGGWRVALRDPADVEAEPLGWVSLKDQAFSGSGTLHARHITDPRTGRAAPGNRAAWAVADAAARADALTTAFCVMDI